MTCPAACEPAEQRRIAGAGIGDEAAARPDLRQLGSRDPRSSAMRCIRCLLETRNRGEQLRPQHRRYPLEVQLSSETHVQVTPIIRATWPRTGRDSASRQARGGAEQQRMRPGTARPGNASGASTADRVRERLGKEAGADHRGNVRTAHHWRLAVLPAPTASTRRDIRLCAAGPARPHSPTSGMPARNTRARLRERVDEQSRRRPAQDRSGAYGVRRPCARADRPARPARPPRSRPPRPASGRPRSHSSRNGTSRTARRSPATHACARLRETRRWRVRTSSGCERSSRSEPSGFARRHSNGRRAVGRQRFRQHQQTVETVARLNAGAAQNGNRGSTLPSRPPSAGPSTKPRPNATPIMPNAAARLSAGVTSATYAMPVVMLAAQMPEITRPTKQPAEVRRQRHHHVVETETEVRNQDHRAAPEAVGQRAHDRHRHELHRRPDDAEATEDARGAAPYRRRGSPRSASAAPARSCRAPACRARS